MRRRFWLLALLAAWGAFSMPARAQEAGTPFQPVEFVADPSSRDSSNFCRLALTSATQGEFTLVQGAKALQGNWALVAGPRIRFVGPDGAVWPFEVDEGEIRLFGHKDHTLRTESSWPSEIAADPKRHARPKPLSVRTGGRQVCTLERYTDGQADWSWSEFGVVSVTVEEKGPDTLVVRFPDATDRTIVRKGQGWEDAAAAAAQPFDESKARRFCSQNLKQLAAIFVTLRAESPGRPKYDGAALFLSWRKSKNPIREEEEVCLICPGDPARLPLDESRARRLYDTVDLANPTPGLCSYAVRDFSSFPLSSESQKKEPIACCRQGADGRTPHHKGGINVAFDDGSVEFLSPEALGLAPGDPIVVGPDSKSDVLRKLVYIKKR